MLVVVMISFPIFWELFQRNENAGLRTLRVVFAIAMIISFAGAAYIKEYLAKRELASNIGIANDRLHLAMESGKSVGWDWDVKSGRDTWFGDLETVFGIPGDTYRGYVEDFRRRVHPQDRTRVWHAVNEAMKHRGPYSAEFRVVRADGTVRWITAKGKFYFQPNGETKRMLGMAIDVTELKQAQQALQESEERLRMAIHAGRMYAYEWDARSDAIIRSGDIPGVIASAVDASLTRQQLLTRVHPEDRAQVAASVTERTPENPDIQVSYRLPCPDGSMVWLEKTAHAFFDEDGKMARMVGMVADITQRKRAEDAFRKSEMQYRRIVGTTNEGVWLLDTNFCNSYVNQQLAEMLGYEPEEMIGRSVLDFYFPEDIERKKEVLERRRQGVREQIEERLRRKDGSELWVRIAGTPVFRDDGEFDGALAMVSDITQRKHAEETLRQSEEKFRSVFRDAGVGMVIVSPEGRFLGANRAFCECLGYTEEELLQKTVEAVTFHDDWPAFSKLLKETLTEGRGYLRFEKRCLHKSGRIVHTESSASLIRGCDGSPQYFVGEVIDVTKRKQAEEALSDMTRKLVEAQELERARIARELHDNTTQQLAMLAIELSQLRKRTEDLPLEVRDRMYELQQMTSEISTGVHALSHELHSSTLELLGLVTGMRGWCKEFGERQQLQIDFRSDDVPKLPQDTSLCLFRVLQEALQNAAKHSGVKQIAVQLTVNSGEIHLIVRDSGKGFDMDSAMRSRGLGLTSMQERVRLVGGTLAVDSKPLAGTTIHVSVPFGTERECRRQISADQLGLQQP